MCILCDTEDEVLLEDGELVDTHGGDTFRNIYYCPSTDAFWKRYDGNMPGEEACEAWEVNDLRVQFSKELAEVAHG